MKNLRKATGDEIHCDDCKWAGLRWWSKRLECRFHGNIPYAVARKDTCDYADRGVHISREDKR